MVKRCWGCKTEKDTALFGKHKGRPDGLNGYCLKCGAKQRLSWKRANPERAKKLRQPEYCRLWLARHPDKTEADYYSRPPKVPMDKKTRTMNMHLRQKYGITLADRQQMERDQGGRCAICHCKCNSLKVDHNHTTGKVRELLCNTCNTTVGFVEKQAERITKAFQYVRKHSSPCNVLPMRECVGNPTGSTYTLFSLPNSILGQAEETVN